MRVSLDSHAAILYSNNKHQHFVHGWAHACYLNSGPGLFMGPLNQNYAASKERKRSTGGLYSAPPAVIVLELLDIAVSVFSDVSYSRPYPSNKKDAYKHHASKCAHHLHRQYEQVTERKD